MVSATQVKNATAVASSRGAMARPVWCFKAISAPEARRPAVIRANQAVETSSPRMRSATMETSTQATGARPADSIQAGHAPPIITKPSPRVAQHSAETEYGLEPRLCSRHKSHDLFALFPHTPFPFSRLSVVLLNAQLSTILCSAPFLRSFSIPKHATTVKRC